MQSPHKPKVVIALPLPPDQVERIAAVAEVVRPTGPAPLSPDELKTALMDADAVLLSVFQPVGPALLADAPRLRCVTSIGVGTDHIDLAACKGRGVTVTNTPGVVNEPTADHVFALMLTAARKIVEADAYVRAGRWTSPHAPLLGLDLHHRTLGIIGLGAIGSQVARRALGFEMKLLYTQPERAASKLETRLCATHVPLDELLAQSDFVVVQVPLLPQTRHLINAAALARMKKTAILVNAARGGVVDDAALAQALAEGRIAGAALDVVENEPAVLPALLQAPNLVLSPHLGSATGATRYAMVVQAVDNLLAALVGQEPPDRVRAA